MECLSTEKQATLGPRTVIATRLALLACALGIFTNAKQKPVSENSLQGIRGALAAVPCSLMNLQVGLRIFYLKKSLVDDLWLQSVGQD